MIPPGCTGKRNAGPAENTGPEVMVSVDEQEFPVLGEGPHLVVDQELEGVHVGPDALEEGDDRVVLGHRGIAAFAGIVELIEKSLEIVDLGLRSSDVVGDQFDEVHLRDGDLLEILGSVDLLQVLHVLQEDVLIPDGDGDDVVGHQIAEGLGLDGQLLTVDLPEDLLP